MDSIRNPFKTGVLWPNGQFGFKAISRAVVHDASLSLESGEVVGLLGPNGAGKTTSFYMIVRINGPGSD